MAGKLSQKQNEKMKVGFIKDKYAEKNNYIKLYQQVLRYNNIESSIIDINSISFFSEVDKVDVIVFRWGHYDSDRQIAHTLLPVIELYKKKKCFPDFNTSWHYDDKIKQYYFLKSFNYAYVDTFVFWDKHSALEWIEHANFPIIFKLKGGAGSKNVCMLNSKGQARKKIIKIFSAGYTPNAIDKNSFNLKRNIRHFGGNILRFISGNDVSDTWQKEKNYILLQKYLPNNEYDTRVTTIGNRAFAFRRFNRSNDFRASGSGKIDYTVSAIDLKCIKIALEISENLHFQTMAYDFIYNESGEPEFCEISYTYEDKAVYNCTGYWDNNLNFHEGHYLPQYFHLLDLLGIMDLKQPENIFSGIQK
jgi:glutathione synthase/RimK-type ligase-like ATP-grasp enzyme